MATPSALGTPSSKPSHPRPAFLDQRQKAYKEWYDSNPNAEYSPYKALVVNAEEEDYETLQQVKDYAGDLQIQPPLAYNLLRNTSDEPISTFNPTLLKRKPGFPTAPKRKSEALKGTPSNISSISVGSRAYRYDKEATSLNLNVKRQRRDSSSFSSRQSGSPSVTPGQSFSYGNASPAVSQTPYGADGRSIMPPRAANPTPAHAAQKYSVYDPKSYTPFLGTDHPLLDSENSFARSLMPSENTPSRAALSRSENARAASSILERAKAASSEGADATRADRKKYDDEKRLIAETARQEKLERVVRERKMQEQAEEQRRLDAENQVLETKLQKQLAESQLRKQKLEYELAEQARLEQEQLEQEHLERRRLEVARLARERAEKEASRKRSREVTPDPIVETSTPAPTAEASSPNDDSIIQQSSPSLPTIPLNGAKKQYLEKDYVPGRTGDIHFAENTSLTDPSEHLTDIPRDLSTIFKVDDESSFAMLQESIERNKASADELLAQPDFRPATYNPAPNPRAQTILSPSPEEYIPSRSEGHDHELGLFIKREREKSPDYARINFERARENRVRIQAEEDARRSDLQFGNDNDGEASDQDEDANRYRAAAARGDRELMFESRLGHRDEVLDEDVDAEYEEYRDISGLYHGSVASHHADEIEEVETPAQKDLQSESEDDDSLFDEEEVDDVNRHRVNDIHESDEEDTHVENERAVEPDSDSDEGDEEDMEGGAEGEYDSEESYDSDSRVQPNKTPVVIDLLETSDEDAPTEVDNDEEMDEDVDEFSEEDEEEETEVDESDSPVVQSNVPYSGTLEGETSDEDVEQDIIHASHERAPGPEFDEASFATSTPAKQMSAEPAGHSQLEPTPQIMAFGPAPTVTAPVTSSTPQPSSMASYFKPSRFGPEFAPQTTFTPAPPPVKPAPWSNFHTPAPAARRPPPRKIRRDNSSDDENDMETPEDDAFDSDDDTTPRQAEYTSIVQAAIDRQTDILARAASPIRMISTEDLNDIRRERERSPLPENAFTEETLARNRQIVADMFERKARQQGAQVVEEDREYVEEDPQTEIATMFEDGRKSNEDSDDEMDYPVIEPGAPLTPAHGLQRDLYVEPSTPSAQVENAPVNASPPPLLEPVPNPLFVPRVEISVPPFEHVTSALFFSADNSMVDPALTSSAGTEMHAEVETSVETTTFVEVEETIQVEELTGAEAAAALAEMSDIGNILMTEDLETEELVEPVVDGETDLNESVLINNIIPAIGISYPPLPILGAQPQYSYESYEEQQTEVDYSEDEPESTPAPAVAPHRMLQIGGIHVEESMGSTVALSMQPGVPQDLDEEITEVSEDDVALQVPLDVEDDDKSAYLTADKMQDVDMDGDASDIEELEAPEDQDEKSESPGGEEDKDEPVASTSEIKIIEEESEESDPTSEEDEDEPTADAAEVARLEADLTMEDSDSDTNTDTSDEDEDDEEVDGDLVRQLSQELISDEDETGDLAELATVADDDEDIHFDVVAVIEEQANPDAPTEADEVTKSDTSTNEEEQEEAPTVIDEEEEEEEGAATTTTSSEEGENSAPTAPPTRTLRNRTVTLAT